MKYRFALAVSLAAISAAPALSQAVITTVAGTGLLFPDGVTALKAPVGNPRRSPSTPPATSTSALPVSMWSSRSAPDGIAKAIAGNRIDGFSGEGGPATSASLSQPADVVFDSAGRMVIADANNNRIRRVDADGTIRTIAGNGASKPGATVDPRSPPVSTIPSAWHSTRPAICTNRNTTNTASARSHRAESSLP